jgi:hypothetical protein
MRILTQAECQIESDTVNFFDAETINRMQAAELLIPSGGKLYFVGEKAGSCRK